MKIEVPGAHIGKICSVQRKKGFNHGYGSQRMRGEKQQNGLLIQIVIARLGGLLKKRVRARSLRWGQRNHSLDLGSAGHLVLRPFLL